MLREMSSFQKNHRTQATSANLSPEKMKKKLSNSFTPAFQLLNLSKNLKNILALPFLLSVTILLCVYFQQSSKDIIETTKWLFSKMPLLPSQTESRPKKNGTKYSLLYFLVLEKYKLWMKSSQNLQNMVANH